MLEASFLAAVFSVFTDLGGFIDLGSIFVFVVVSLFFAGVGGGAGFLGDFIAFEK